MTLYNKIVRDKIPEMIANTGRKPLTKVLDDENYVKYLKETLLDEAIEYKLTTDQHTLEELADVLEVIHALVEAQGEDMSTLESIRAEKAKTRGGFSKKLLLVEVEDKGI